MFSEDDFQYAIENTVVVRPPTRNIQTFGTTTFRFYLVTELMDRVNEIRVREGRIEAERPQILTAEKMSRILLEGFGEKAGRFAEMLRHNPDLGNFLRYGMQIVKRDMTETTAHESMELVLNTIDARIAASDETSVIIQGVDDAWEVCLLKFSMDLIQQSLGGNVSDLRRRKLL
ncbi:MAG TPA: hypothetical protein VF585_01585 [Chthoniobacterales bacterium]|jgi:hypothetical protein